MIDEPTNLLEGKVIELVPLDETLTNSGDYLDPKERAALHRSIDEGIDNFERGEVEDAFKFLTRLKARHKNRDRQGCMPASRTGK